jgi:hypothetical protein
MLADRFERPCAPGSIESWACTIPEAVAWPPSHQQEALAACRRAEDRGISLIEQVAAPQER